MAQSPPFPKLSVSQLKIGQTIKLPLSWTNHPFLRNRVYLKSEVEIEMIKGLKVPYVLLLSDSKVKDALISDDKSNLVIESEEQDDSVDEIAQFRKFLNTSQKRTHQTVADNKAVFSKVVTDPEGAYRISAATVSSLLSHMMELSDPAIVLVENSESLVSVSQHCVSVTVISMLMARVLKLEEHLIRDIALGCLLHDYGKQKIPDSILRKKDELTSSELNFYKQHPNYGVKALCDQEYVSKVALHIVGHHHEFIDGSGYPDGLKGNQIPLSTQIVSLANEFDNLLSDQRFPTPQIALGYLFKNGTKRHDAKLISALVKVMGIYPPGTLVALSDGRFAKVLMSNKNVKQPYVLSCDEDGDNVNVRMLSQEDVQVEKVITLETLSDNAKISLKVNQQICFYFASGANFT